MSKEERLTKKFKETFFLMPEHIFSSGGRVEIIGNHTDHNHGKCIAASCNLCITAAVSKTNSSEISFVSEGFERIDINLNKLEHVHGENPSAEMVKGVAKYFVDHGYKIGGFKAYLTSTIFSGAGVSSSAAFELLFAQILNVLFNDSKVDTMFMCKAGQYSENSYYEKNSGLLDQIGAGFGNLVSIDFEDIKNPKVKTIKFPFDDIHFVIVNTGGSHSGLNELYSSIPMDMKNAAKKMGHEFLRECNEEEFKLNKDKLTDMERSRTIHFMSENKRVDDAIKALEAKDKEGFLNAINGSRESSTNDLKNMMVKNHYECSPLEATDRALKLLNGEGACRINGGGFAGSIICFVPTKRLDNFINEMSKYYGKKNVVEVFVRKTGPIKEK